MKQKVIALLIFITGIISFALYKTNNGNKILLSTSHNGAVIEFFKGDSIYLKNPQLFYKSTPTFKRLQEFDFAYCYYLNEKLKDSLKNTKQKTKLYDLLKHNLSNYKFANKQTNILSDNFYVYRSNFKTGQLDTLLLTKDSLSEKQKDAYFLRMNSTKSAMIFYEYNYLLYSDAFIKKLETQLAKLKKNSK